MARLGDKGRLASIESALKGDNNDDVQLAGSFASIVLSSGLMDPIAEALRRPRLAARAREYLIEIAPGRSTVFRRYAQDPDAHIRSGMADVLGLAGDFRPKFVKTFVSLSPLIARAAGKFRTEVTRGRFPSGKYSYSMQAGEWENLRKELGRRS